MHCGRLARRILVVDDEPAIRFALREYLAGHDWAVDCAGDRGEASALLAQRSYDVVVADLRLHVARDDDGLEVLSEVRSRHPGTHTVLLTAYGSPGVELEARRRGADVVLHKPQSLREIERIVDALTARS